MSNNRRPTRSSSSEVKRACVDLEVEEVEEVAVELRAKIVELERSLAASVEQLEEKDMEIGSLKESRERLTRDLLWDLHGAAS